MVDGFVAFPAWLTGTSHTQDVVALCYMCGVFFWGGGNVSIYTGVIETFANTHVHTWSVKLGGLL